MKRLIECLVVLCLVLCLASGVAWSQEAPDEKEPDELCELLESAESGDAEAMFALADRYQSGEKVERDEQLATKYYLQAVEKGHSRAAMRMAFRYMEGLGVEPDAEKGWKMLHDGAAAGDGDALFGLSIAHWFGLNGLEKDSEKALELMERAVAQDPEFGIYKYLMCWKSGRFEEAEALLGTLKDTLKDTGSEEEKAFCELMLFALEFSRDCEEGRGPENNREALEKFIALLLAFNGQDPDVPEARFLKGWVYQLFATVSEEPELGRIAFENLRDLPADAPPPCTFLLAGCYWDGIGTEIDRPRAKELICRAAKGLWPSAVTAQALLVELPKGAEGREKARRMLQWASMAYAPQGYRAPSVCLALLLLDEGKDEEAVRVLRGCLKSILAQQAETPEKEAPRFPLGMELDFRYQGGGVGDVQFGFGFSSKGNSETGAEPTAEARKKLDLTRLESLADVERLSYLDLAGSDSLAVTLLAGCYRDGRGVAPDPELEKALLELAAAWRDNQENQENDGGVHEAQAELLRTLDAEPDDEEDPLLFLTLSSEMGIAEAQITLAGYYARGECVAQDMAEAVRWLTLAADQGNALAQEMVGGMYLSGVGVAEDAARGARYLKRAAKQGAPGAQYYLALCYAQGKGVKQDLAEMERWLKLAADQGHEAARELLEKLRR